MLGVFTTENVVQPEALADFARMYTLSILWPYAREYTSDQLRRAGQPFESLPIINPQMITEKLIEGGLVKIEISSHEDQTSDSQLVG
jgi:preprotein translocase subunit SecB